MGWRPRLGGGWQPRRKPVYNAEGAAPPSLPEGQAALLPLLHLVVRHCLSAGSSAATSSLAAADHRPTAKSLGCPPRRRPTRLALGPARPSLDGPSTCVLNLVVGVNAFCRSGRRSHLTQSPRLSVMRVQSRPHQAFTGLSSERLEACWACTRQLAGCRGAGRGARIRLPICKLKAALSHPGSFCPKALNFASAKTPILAEGRAMPGARYYNRVFPIFFYKLTYNVFKKTTGLST